MISVYGVRFQALQDHYHQDNNKLRYISELRNLALDIRRKEPTEQLVDLLKVVEDIEGRLVNSNFKFNEVE